MKTSVNDLLFQAKKYLSEGSHGLTGVGSDKSLKKRNRSGNLLFGQETNDTHLSRSSVVELNNETSCLGLFTAVLGEAEGIEEVEGNGMGDRSRVVRELREGSGLTATHVMSSVGLTELLQESNKNDDLPLGDIRKGIPLLRRRSGLERERGTVSCNGPGEVDSVGLNDVTDEGSHGNTSVLDLSMTQEADAGLVALSPDGGGGQLKRIVVLRKNATRNNTHISSGLKNQYEELEKIESQSPKGTHYSRVIRHIIKSTPAAE
jgi:hypothetical protein